MNTDKKFFINRKSKNILWNVLALIISCIFLFPIYWIIVSSLKSDIEIFAKPITLLPQKIVFDGYIQQLTGKYSILVSAKNSFIIAISAMICSFLLAIPASYGLSKFKVPGAGIITIVFLVTQMLPSSLLLTPLYINFSKLHLLNTRIAPVLGVMTITIPFTILILRPIFMSIPNALNEAALIDGCNRFTSFIRIILPNVTPGLVTCACFGFVHGWNDLVYSLTFNTKEYLHPMTTSIYNLMTEYGIRWNWIMAYGVMLVIPPLLIFIFAQKYIISGITGGAVKG